MGWGGEAHVVQRKVLLSFWSAKPAQPTGLAPLVSLVGTGVDIAVAMWGQ